MQTYKTQDGDVLDAIAWRHYGALSAELLRNLYAANPHVVELPTMLPAGVAITLPPEAAPSDEVQAVALWS